MPYTPDYRKSPEVDLERERGCQALELSEYHAKECGPYIVGRGVIRRFEPGHGMMRLHLKTKMFVRERSRE
jgi:hypothetical protein